MHICVCGDYLTTTGQCNKGVVAVELRHGQSLDYIMQRIQPVHEDPEVRKQLRTDEEASE